MHGRRKPVEKPDDQINLATALGVEVPNLIGLKTETAQALSPEGVD